MKVEPQQRWVPAGAVELVSGEAVQSGFDTLARELQPLVIERDCMLLGVLNGGLYPLMQLMQRLSGDYLVDYCHASRYLEGMQGGALQWLREPPKTVNGRTVLVVDDIYDEGHTLAAVVAACRAGGAVEVLTAVEVIKDNPRRAAAGWPDYSTGITVPDVYVFGCGMDYEGRWRHLPSIYALRPEQGR